jgi:hypothetical protein
MNPLDQPALIWLSWKNRLGSNRRIALVQTQIGLPGSCIRTMARPAVVGEDWSDIARVIDCLAGHLQVDPGDGQAPNQ